MKRLFVTGLLFMFMAVAPLFHAVADTQYAWKYTPLAIKYTITPSLLELTESGEDFNTYTVKTTTTSAQRGLYVTNGETVPANHKYFVKLKLKSNYTQTPYLRYSIDGSYSNLNLENYVPNEWSTGIAIITPTNNWTIGGSQFGILPASNRYIAGETITVDKNGFLTVFDLTEIFGAGNEPSTAAKAEQLLLDIPEIKIATTAYNAARFNPVKTDLDSAVATIREIVTKTINQTAAIASLQADKQTRPEDACPAGKKCLLVETEENGVIVPHWFPIIEAPEDN